MAEDAQIIQLRPGLEELERDALIREKEKERRYCPHKRIELDDEVRRVYCRDCSEEVPAFDALENFRRRFDRYVSLLREAKAEAAYRKRVVEELKREERNAKSRLRAVRAKLRAAGVDG